ncbi:MAG: PstS family phosphate ABC transporter substrate-binding protein [Kiritimatiellae bacterium]|nr:PstS family phosphate ABC transporter substrate-binding protein [Kiritimatiellia bacterium]MDD5522713.1 PstS family phosphate ABC transporter substrate-binding protein [Kiritimatiellia bacterium]
MKRMRRTCRVIGLVMAAGMLVVSGCSRNSKKQGVTPQAGTGGKITISGAWALYPMVVKWAEEFKKVHPGVVIDISAGGAGKGMADALSQAVDLGMISREINPVEVSKGAWWVSVVKDAVVPTINAENPVVNAVLKRGMTSNEFTAVWVTGKTTRWDSLVQGTSGEVPIHVYTRSDACGAAETWAKYLGGNQQDLKAIAVYGDPGLAEAVRKDKLGIGFNNINFVYDAKTKVPVTGLRIIPIDVNNNGKIDKEEEFYSTLDELIAAIGDGRYPSPPARALHLVSFGQPKNKAVIEFLKWVLADGQKYVPEAGYINLPKDRLSEELKKFESGK